ncbi:MAG TPA: dodecin [Geminicoccaceae bacterium]|nr:dodecin [Geminicoccaceae bacterium]
MDNQVYKVVEIVGASEKSVEDAIQAAITRASQTLEGLGWFQIVETRGSIIDGRIGQYQVVLKVGFHLQGRG